MLEEYEMIAIVALCNGLRYVVFALIIQTLFSTLPFSF